MRISTRGLLAVLLGAALALAIGLMPGMAKTARADATPTYTITATDPDETVPLSESAALSYDVTLQSIAQEYPLWVGGTQVTDENKGDVLKGTANGGKVSFTPASGQTSATLTLNGANITTGYVFNDGDNVSHSYGIYYTDTETDPLTIVVASDSTVDVSGEKADVVAGIFCEYSGLAITGEGKLTATSVAEGISGLGDVTIDKGVVEATGLSSAINAREGNVVITNDSTVETNGSINGKRVAINSGIVKASGESSGIFGDSVTIRGGEVTATASNGNGIAANSTNDGPGTVTISGGTVIATGGANGSGIYTQKYGVREPPGNVTIDGGIASVTASGGKQAIEGIVTNAVAGMGWTDAAGTTGKEAIAASEAGQTLSFKKVQFPPLAEVVEKPEPTDPTYDGKAQELVTAGTAKGGAMRYSLDGETWSDKVPTGTDMGAYTVWYKAVGDDQHADSEPQKVTSTIAKEDEPADALDLSGSGHEQNVGDAAARAEGKGILIGTTGESKRLEQFSVALPEGTDGSIEYRGHLQSKGWVDWSKDGAPCGTTSESRRVEAVQMQLSGAVADDYSVWYRAHVQNMGWLGWARDGQAAGTAGQSLRAEAIEVQVLPKGQVPEGYVEREASYVGAVSANVHLQNQGWAGASSAIEFGTTGQSRRLEAVRLSGPATPVSAGISYEVHVQNKGWLPPVADGALAGTTGQSRRLEAVRISLTGDAAGEGEYSVWYRVHSQSHGWLGWAHDGQEAGTTGLSKRAEAIDVQVLPQGQLPRGYDASRAACVTR